MNYQKWVVMLGKENYAMLLKIITDKIMQQRRTQKGIYSPEKSFEKQGECGYLRIEEDYRCGAVIWNHELIC